MIDIFGDISSISIESFPEDVEMPSGLFHNGIWRKTSNKVGTFVHKVSEVPLNLGLTKDCEVSFERDESIPKPPVSIFYALLDFYKEVSLKSSVKAKKVFPLLTNLMPAPVFFPLTIFSIFLFSKEIPKFSLFSKKISAKSPPPEIR